MLPGVWLAHGSSGWELGKNELSFYVHSLAAFVRIFILMSSLTGEDLPTKSSLMASASGPRFLCFFVFLWKKCFQCECGQVMDANSFLCEGGILHRERIFVCDNGSEFA